MDEPRKNKHGKFSMPDNFLVQTKPELFFVRYFIGDNEIIPSAQLEEEFAIENVRVFAETVGGC